jgi:hypothetical protein
LYYAIIVIVLRDLEAHTAHSKKNDLGLLGPLAGHGDAMRTLPVIAGYRAKTSFVQSQNCAPKVSRIMVGVATGDRLMFCHSSKLIQRLLYVLQCYEKSLDSIAILPSPCQGD